MRKFAWFSKIVRTWRPKGTNAIIWLQYYHISRKGKYCLYLGCFSYEFYN